jgi:hypothetical protein
MPSFPAPPLHHPAGQTPIGASPLACALCGYNFPPGLLISALRYIQREGGEDSKLYTVRKMDLILRPIERRPQMQFSMAHRFKLQLLRRYSVKFSKMRIFTLGTLWLGKLKNTGWRRTSILRICSLWLYHCATVICDTRTVFFKWYKHFSPYLPDCVKFHSNENKVAENALFHTLSIKWTPDYILWNVFWKRSF